MKNTYITVALVIAGLLGAGGLIWFTDIGGNLMRKEAEVVTGDAAAVVATVGGGATSITRGQLDAQIQGLVNNPQIQVPEVTQTEARIQFERAALDQMIGGMLFLDEAKRQGFTVDDAAVDNELAAITVQYESSAAFAAALAESQLSEESLRENIRNQLITAQYYDKIAVEHVVTASAEEVRAFYDTQVAPQDEKIVFEDIEGEIKTHIEQQKMQEVVVAVIAELYKSADVEIRI